VTPHEIKNMAASVHERLKTHSERAGRTFNEVLVMYGDRAVPLPAVDVAAGPALRAQGGLMLMVWKSSVYRPTRDIDLLGHMPNDPAVVAGVMRSACVQPVVDDGLTFDPGSVESAPIAAEKDYDGVRVTFAGHLGMPSSTCR